jgi:hypothetical protein
MHRIALLGIEGALRLIKGSVMLEFDKGQGPISAELGAQSVSFDNRRVRSQSVSFDKRIRSQSLDFDNRGVAAKARS